MKSLKIIDVCLGVWLWFPIVACSVNYLAMTTSQNSIVAKVVDEKITRALDCNKPSEYSFLEVQSPKRQYDRYLNIVVGDEVMARIALPNSTVNNFSLNSVEKTKGGFEVKVDWGGGVYHYEVQYHFRCKKNNFYLYKVRRVSFSTKNPDSGNFLDIKRTKVIRIDPNLHIDKFVMDDYLR